MKISKKRTCIITHVNSKIEWPEIREYFYIDKQVQPFLFKAAKKHPLPLTPSQIIQIWLMETYTDFGVFYLLETFVNKINTKWWNDCRVMILPYIMLFYLISRAFLIDISTKSLKSSFTKHSSLYSLRTATKLSIIGFFNLSINWPSVIVRMPLLHEILRNKCNATVC